MREVPEHQRPGRVHLLGDGGHVERLARAVVDLGQLDQGHVVVEFLVEAIAIDRLHRDGTTGALTHRLDDVDVRVEVGRVGQDHVTIGPVFQRGADEFREQEREGVGDEDLARSGPDQWRDAVPQSRRRGHPPGVVPAAHESTAPLVVEDLVDASADRGRHGTERVAVEVDLGVVQRERLAQRSELVRVVQLLAVDARDHRIDRTSQRAG